MKTLKCMAILLLIGIVSGCYPVPVSGPAPAYSDADYYYYPDEEVYYYPVTSQYIYFDGGAWTYATMLPPHYSINPYTTNRVVLNYSGKDPYRYHNRYKEEYPRGYSGHRLTVPSRQTNNREENRSGYHGQKQTPPARQPRVRNSQMDNAGKSKPVKPEKRNGRGRVKSEK